VRSLPYPGVRSSLITRGRGPAEVPSGRRPRISMLAFDASGHGDEAPP